MEEAKTEVTPEANGTSETPARRRRVAKPAAAPKEPKAGRKKREQTPLQEAAKAEPKIKALGKRIEKAQAQMGKLIKEREKIVKALSEAATKLLGL